MSPLGKLIIDLRYLTLKDLNLWLLLLLGFYFLLFACGMILAGRGLNFLEDKS